MSPCEKRRNQVARIFVAGHKGMVGSAICRQLQGHSDVEVLTATRSEVDLTDQSVVRQYFADKHIDQVYLAAAKVGGIHANNEYPAEFIYENLINKRFSYIKIYTNTLCQYPKNV